MTPSEVIPRPVVGLTSYLDPAVTEGCGTVEAAFLPSNYLAPVLAVGAIPVLLPPQGTDGGVVEQLLPRLDGVIVVGGWDVDPARYGAEPHAETDDPHLLRDAWDIAVVREAVRADVPLLGICRGSRRSMWRSAGRCTSTCPTSTAAWSTSSVTTASTRSRWISAPVRGWHS